jgi:PEGA domain-containing protein/tetratricopeptide repeat protein
VRRAVSLAVAALAAALLAAAPHAAADDVAEAKAQFRRGADLYRAGKWREAIDAFEAAYRLKPHGAIRFNVAQCRERLGEWPAALAAYEDYLREVPDAKDRAAVRAAMQKIEQRLASAGVQALLVYTDPPGAQVRVDGKGRGTTPFHTVLPPGPYALSLSLDGYEPFAEDVTLAATASRVVDEVLRPAAPRAPPVQAVAPVPAAVAVAAAQPPADLRVEPPASAPPAPILAASAAPPKERKRVYTWVAAGTAVAAAAAGAYFGWSAQQDADKVDGIVNDGAQAQQAASDAQSKAHTANVLYAVSGAAAAAGITLFFVEGKF